MKRLFVLVLVLLFTFGLASCDLLPEDIQDQISEELCKNDPDNELCQLDALDDLEDTLVLGLIEDLYEKYMMADFKDVCPDFISPSNPDLLEKCRMEEPDFFPEDITSYTPTMVEKEGNMYKIMGEHNLSGKDFVIMVSVVLIETKYYIEDYSYTVTDKPIPTEITEEMAFMFFEEFFMYFDDKDMTNDDFCMKFYDGEDNDCDDIRDGFFDEFTEIDMYEAVSYAASSVDGHVTVLKIAGGGSEDYDITLKLMLDDMGMIRATEFSTGEDNDCDGVCMVEEEREEAIESYQMYLDDYIDMDITDAELTEMYFAENQTEAFYDIRKEVQAAKNKSTVIDVVGPIDVDTFIFVIIEEENGMMGFRHEPVTIRKRIDKATPLLAFGDPDDDGDGIPIDEKLMILDNFKNNINHLSVANMDACRMTVPEYRLDSCSRMRQDLIDNDLMIHNIQLIMDMDGNSFLRIIKRPDLLTGEWDEMMESYLVYFYKTESGYIETEMVSLSGIFIPSTEHEDSWETNLAAINDTTQPIDEVCMKVSTSSYETCMDMRTRVNTGNTMAKTIAIEVMEEMTLFTVAYVNGDGAPDVVVSYTVRNIMDDEHLNDVLEIIETPSDN